MVNTQISLFDTSTEVVESYYKTGDWVQLKRKSKNAAYIKKGDIVQVEAVHPVNGSIKFWNEHTQRYDFLYPEEIKLAVEPVFGEIPKLTVESVVENSAVAESVVENSAVAESVVENSAVAESVVENPAVAESVVENSANINSGSGYYSNGWFDFHYKIRIGGKQQSTRQEKAGCTGPYYTYRWLEEKIKRSKYVPSKKFGEV
jgi:hypothetical protein